MHELHPVARAQLRRAEIRAARNLAVHLGGDALRLKAAGMPLKTVKRYIALDAAGEPARGERTRLLLETCEALDEKLKNLQNSLRLARELLNEEAAPRGESCAAA